MTVGRILEGADVTFVLHGTDKLGWQFLPDGRPNASDAVLTTRGELVSIDPSLSELDDLPEGWIARRSRRGAPWRRGERAVLLRVWGTLKRTLAKLTGKRGTEKVRHAASDTGGDRPSSPGRPAVVVRSRSMNVATAQRA